MDGLSHIDEKGNAHMVDVTEKEVTKRRAVAAGTIRVSEEVGNAIARGCVPKGDVFSTARIAGIMAAKRTWELIPMCHPLALTSVNIDFEIEGIRGEERGEEVIPKDSDNVVTPEDFDNGVLVGGLPERRRGDGMESLEGGYEIGCRCSVATTGKTGVEMEALTGVSAALLTVYDMCKALDKTMEIGQIRLLEKEGGKSGHFINEGG